ncbi:RNA-binding domain-containing protein [Ascodesmis nigricans]|uniref:RNA-binding domain-containing protein n=1 Tax=Ascodesmis nigricans TaxID=341454 RepID=A0A4S2N7T7_9PEZI|nr:RNA-binding domain-containing protein [Ascodesmis nigricans]
MPPAPPPSSTTSGPPPNQTLYVSNLPDTKIRKPDLRLALYTLFSTYGVVLDVVALLTMKHRGQAHVVFRDISSATQAMRELQGMKVFGKEMKIQYARGKSHKIMKLEGSFAPQPPPGEMKKQEEEESEGEEMEMDDD